MTEEERNSSEVVELFALICTLLCNILLPGIKAPWQDAAARAYDRENLACLKLRLVPLHRRVCCQTLDST